MKTVFAIATLALVTGNAALACTIAPKGDSQLKVNALHDTLAFEEQLAGLEQLDHDTYQIRVKNYSSGQTETREYNLRNTSPMCPKYEATRVR